MSPYLLRISFLFVCHYSDSQFILQSARGSWTVSGSALEISMNLDFMMVDGDFGVACKCLRKLVWRGVLRVELVCLFNGGRPRPLGWAYYDFYSFWNEFPYNQTGTMTCGFNILNFDAGL